ncbi:MAG: TVP38/TMEM64 family protein [Anaerolineales bacterium]|jgi:uncharacterized membrane protein YdjX (TVP38/TMEM64 family)
MNLSHIKRNKSKWLKIALAILGVAAALYWRTQLFEIIAMIGNREAIVAYLEQYGILGPLVLFVILGLQVFLAIIPGHAFIVAGGYIYGLLIGALITQTSTVIASQLAFLLARRYGYSLVHRMAPEAVIARWDHLAQSQGGLFFFFAFILPIFPNDLMSFIAGLSTISARKFFVANFFGRLPCAIFVTLIGSHGFEMPLSFWVVMVLVIVGLCLVWKSLSNQIQKHWLHNKGRFHDNFVCDLSALAQIGLWHHHPQA